ncbi:hypothetical protein K466DRAFT_570374 [Polyporus arcularius HHB13444]|uniref:DUF5648 domain-containing protein n=1 Tax=Polyporus arcularius HHB13444 TaxID=1314778 RepID=A0A5C3NRK6_9APHY|nr:hypothetical protein K466DRAFT_570374 [Polyporus arcularius HHB13444]
MKFNLAAIVAAVLFSQAGALPAPEPSAALKLEALSAAARTAAAAEAVASAAIIEARTAAARLSAAVALSAAVRPTAAVIDAVASAAAVEARSAAAIPSAAVEFEVLSAAVRATAAAVATQAVDVRDAHEARAVNACGYPVVPLYRAVSDSLSDRIFTTDASEVEAALASKKYVRSAILAAVYSNTTGSSVPGAIPLYRLYSAAKTDHFITTSWDEVETAVGGNGYEYQGITAQYNPSIEDHFYSTTKPESAKSSTTGVDGWFYEGITGYVFPPQ